MNRNHVPTTEAFTHQVIGRNRLSSSWRVAGRNCETSFLTSRWIYGWAFNRCRWEHYLQVTNDHEATAVTG